VLAAAPFADAPQADAARAFVDFLAAPAALDQYRRNGMEPAR
jgi:ABC-type molybdate transport system substrate-binding protein